MDMITILGLGVLALVIYFLFVRWGWKWLLKRQVSCFGRATFLALFLAPGLLLFSEHAGIPLPALAWMSALSNAYNCIENNLFCGIKLNLYLSVLPFLATWVFVFLLCKSPEPENGDQ